MNPENKGALTRILLLIRNAVLLSRSSIFFVTAALTGGIVILSFINTHTDCSPQFHRNVFLWIFFPTGIYLSSRAFRDLHDPVKGYAWLLLPASPLEKTLSRILLTTLVYSAACLVMYFIISTVSEGVNILVSGRCHFWFNPLDPFILKCVWFYICAQAPFLAGAAYFKKHGLSKTILFLMGFLVFFSVGILAAARIIFGPGFLSLNFGALRQVWETGVFHTMGAWFINAVQVLSLVLLPAVCWIICYLRHKEAEL